MLVLIITKGTKFSKEKKQNPPRLYPRPSSSYLGENSRLKSSHVNWKLWAQKVSARISVGDCIPEEGKALVPTPAHRDPASHKEPKEPFLAKNKLSLPGEVPRRETPETSVPLYLRAPPHRMCRPGGPRTAAPDLPS